MNSSSKIEKNVKKQGWILEDTLVLFLCSVELVLFFLLHDHPLLELISHLSEGILHHPLQYAGSLFSFISFLGLLPLS